MSKFGFGIVGCGMIANFHAQAIAHIKGAKIVACFDSFAASAERFAATNGCRQYARLEDMLKDKAVDVITICTPSGAHGDPAVKACHRRYGASGQRNLPFESFHRQTRDRNLGSRR